MIPLSYSALKEYELCPKRFEKRYVRRIKYETGEMRAGRAFHRALEEYSRWLYENGLKSDYDKAVAIANECGMGLPDKDEFVERVVNYLSGYEEQPELLIGVEMSLAVNRGWNFTEWDDENAFLRGVIDKVYRDGDVIVVVDYKTGERISYDKRQFHIYGLLMDRFLYTMEGQRTRKVVGMAVFPRFEYEEQFLITDRDLELAQEWVEVVAGRIEEDMVDGFEGNIGEHCFTCPYRWICEAVKDEVDWDLLKKTKEPSLLVEEYFKLSTRLDVIKGILKELTQDEEITVNGHRVGYFERKEYIWDVERVLDDIKEMGLAKELLKIDSRKGLKYDWLKEKGLVGVKKSTVFGVRKA